MKIETKLLRLPQVMEITSLSKSSIYRYEKAGNFPKRLSLGSNCVVWKLNDINKWISNLAFVAPDGGKN